MPPESFKDLSTDIDVAFYLVHSMSSSNPNFTDLEAQSAQNFVHINQTTYQQVIYLSGIMNDADLSDHLLSRKNVEDVFINGLGQRHSLESLAECGSTMCVAAVVCEN